MSTFQSIQTIQNANNHSRSSVVSVLFSLISETFLRELLRLSTFWIQRGPLSLLMPWLSVASIALPLADANTFSSVSLLVEDIGEESFAPVVVLALKVCCYAAKSTRRRTCC
jgi:hypothetical protein